jgi:glycine/D-amino acid oxidase-like deaminating enzyme
MVAPGVECCYFFDDGYVIPTVGDVVVGGTAQRGDWNEEVDVADGIAILASAVEVLPGLHGLPVSRMWAGLRPARLSGLRIEREDRGHGLCPIVHNYGHGGSGFTVGYGTAVQCNDDFLDAIVLDAQADPTATTTSSSPKL